MLVGVLVLARVLNEGFDAGDEGIPDGQKLSSEERSCSTVPSCESWHGIILLLIRLLFLLPILPSIRLLTLVFL